MPTSCCLAIESDAPSSRSCTPGLPHPMNRADVICTDVCLFTLVGSGVLLRGASTT